MLDRTAEAGIGILLADSVDPLASALVPDIRAAPPQRASRSSGPTRSRRCCAGSKCAIMPAADETLISLHDVSAQRVAESQLNENSHSLQLVENNVDAVLWTVGRDGRFSAVSGGALG